MRSWKVVCTLLCVLVLLGLAAAGGNDQGIRDVYHVKFVAPVRVGNTLLPAGDYTVRHTMEGQDHIMVFQQGSKGAEVKAKCTLVPLAQKADKDTTIYLVNAANERVLQELIFRGDSAKHVF